jgi:hypothetical protein
MAALEVKHTFSYVNKVPEHLRCDVCDHAMRDPVQIIKNMKAFSKGCRRCVKPLCEKRYDMQMVALPELAKDLSMLTVICTNCNDKMMLKQYILHAGLCAFNATLELTDCNICCELYLTADKAAHEITACHTVAKLKMELAYERRKQAFHAQVSGEKKIEQ